MTVDEFARRLNTSVRTVRAYQERGLLNPPELVGRTGYYSETHVTRFHAVQRLQSDGFSLAGIRALLDAWDSGESLGDLIGAHHEQSGTVNADASTLFPATKFQRPVDRSEHIVRRRCLQLVPRGHDSHVLIASPGGSGKSTFATQLVGQWAGPCGWLSLDRTDDEPGGFWTAVLLALQSALPDFGERLLAELVGGGDVDRVLVRMADELGGRSVAVALVLDDLHEVSDPTIIRQLGWLLDRVEPATCRIVMCSRTRPALPTAQLVMNGRLTLLETQHISFDGDETRELLHERLGVELTDTEVTKIAEATDGWAAAIYLTGLTLRSGKPTAAVLNALNTVDAPDRRIQGYFEDEVLQAIDARQLSFLEEISFLDRFSADLCDAVRERSDSAELLGELRGNMFVLRLDAAGYWQRLHQTLASVLRVRVAGNVDPEQLRMRQVRAAHWYGTHELVPEAIDYHLRAADYDTAVQLIAANYPRYLNISHQGAVVDRWLERLPAPLLDTTPLLNLAAAGVAGLRGDAEEMRLWLARAESLPGEQRHNTLAVVELLRACLNFGEVEDGLHAARSASAELLRDGPWYPMQRAALALLTIRADGPTHSVLVLVEEALELEATVHQPIALTGLWALRGLVQAAHGDVNARASVDRASRIRYESGIDRTPQAANTWASTAQAYRLLGDVDRALADSQAGYDIIADLAPEHDATGAVVPVLAELAYALRLSGHSDAAFHHIADAQQRLSMVKGPGLLPRLLAEAAGEDDV